MKIKYDREQKIKGNITLNFDEDYAFLEKALERSGDIVKNVFYVGETVVVQDVIDWQNDINIDSQIDVDTNSGRARKAIPKDKVKILYNNEKKRLDINKKIKPKKAAVIYVDGMTDADMVEDFVIRPLLKNKCEKAGQDLLSYVENHVMETVDWKEDESFEDILTDILSGNTLLLLESCPKAIILSTKKYPSRGVGETCLLYTSDAADE